LTINKTSVVHLHRFNRALFFFMLFKIIVYLFTRVFCCIINKKKNTMSVKFTVLPKKNPQDVLAPEKFYARTIGTGETDMDRLAELISYQCTVTKSDCYAVLYALEHNVIEELKEGKIVKLGALGSYQVSCSSEGKNLASQVTSNSIKKAKIIFRPGVKFREFLKIVSFVKSS